MTIAHELKTNPKNTLRDKKRVRHALCIGGISIMLCIQSYTLIATSNQNSYETETSQHSRKRVALHRSDDDLPESSESARMGMKSLCSAGNSENTCLDNIIDFFHHGEKSVINEENFRSLAEAIAPSKAVVEDATSVAAAVVDATKECSDVHIDRFAIYGSLAKNTSLTFPDIDLTVFLDDAGSPPYASFLERLPQCLEARLPGLTTGAKTIWNIEVNYGGFQIDISPAVNFALGETSTQDEARLVQRRKALEELHALPRKESDEFTLQSTFVDHALCEATVQKWEGRPKIAHDTARLAKLWKKNCLSEVFPYLKLNSLPFELIALVSAEEEVINHPDAPSLVNAIKIFFRYLTNPEDIAIMDNNDPEDIPYWIAVQRPLILDVNPNENKAERIKDWTPIRSAATVSLDALDRELRDRQRSHTIADLVTCSASFVVGRAQLRQK